MPTLTPGIASTFAIIALGSIARGATDGASPATPPERLLVVAPKAFREALAEFVEARSRQLGTPVELLAIEEIEPSDAPAVDAPERLKRELHRRWKAGEVTAVLLVGDADVMPVRFMTLDRATKPAFDVAFYPSDLYYADLARADGSFDDWNARRDGVHAGYFGEVRGEANKQGPINLDAVSYEPEVAVGRWPVSSPEEARAVGAKTLRHQDAVAAAAVERRDPRLRFFISGGWIDNAARAHALVDRLRASGAWTADLHGFFLPDRQPTTEAVASALASGPAAVFHTGHGQPWGWEGCFDRAVMSLAPSCDAPPLLFSIGCSTAVVCTQPPYDAYLDVEGRAHAGTNAGQVFADFPPPPAPLQPGRFNATSVSEEAVRRPDGGAIAAIGCVTGSQPCAHSLLDGFVEAMSREPTASAGRWWRTAVDDYVRRERLMELVPDEGWYPPSIFFQGMKFVFLGDPTVRIR